MPTRTEAEQKVMEEEIAKAEADLDRMRGALAAVCKPGVFREGFAREVRALLDKARLRELEPLVRAYMEACPADSDATQEFLEAGKALCKVLPP